MKQRKQESVKAMLGPGVGTFAVTAFNMWVTSRHLYLPLVAALSAMIMSAALTLTGTAVSALARVGLKTVAGWAATASMIWLVMESPTLAQHLMANVGVFFVACGTGLVSFMSVAI